ncbi:hypothetical protein A8C32_06210 [Flavivirga aquatica]|uniref:Uncharacterized protein n=1 Tax=Flavivirga aquatica TaxID=1849968 RepID=A0A1E5SI25_9FLAO|nr:DUF6095 family protein [Flavivirga aquatica]OEJ98787.1 hypothetical protein A8C32_06210 [Flavivirga aquatica]
METKTDRTNKDILVKGIKIMGISLGCMFLGPTLFYIALTNQEKPLYIPILIIAIIVCVLAVFLAFKGINTILDSMFKKK